VTLVLTDSSRVAGVFTRVGRAALEDYSPRYERWRSSQRRLPGLPAMGARITLVGQGIVDGGRGYFCGLARRGVLYSTRPTGRIRLGRFVEFTALIAGTSRFRVAEVEKLHDESQAPIIDGFELQVDGRAVVVLADDVAWVASPGGLVPAHVALDESDDTDAGPSRGSVQLGLASTGRENTLLGGFLVSHLEPGQPGVEGGVMLGRGYPPVAPFLCLGVLAPVGGSIGLVPEVGSAFVVGGQFGWMSWIWGGAVIARVHGNLGIRADWVRLWVEEETGRVTIIRIGPVWGLRDWRTRRR